MNIPNSIAPLVIGYEQLEDLHHYKDIKKRIVTRERARSTGAVKLCKTLIAIGEIQ